MYALCFFCTTILLMVIVVNGAQDRVVILNTTADDVNVIRKELFAMLNASNNSIGIMNKELHDLAVTVKKLSLISEKIGGNSFCLNMTRSTRVIYEKTLRLCFSKCI